MDKFIEARAKLLTMLQLACPNGQGYCPTGYCTSLYDVVSDSFSDGHTLESCKLKCEDDPRCSVFEFDFSAGNCGVNQRGLSAEAAALRTENLDPGTNGDDPFWADGIQWSGLQCRGQPSHITCYPGNCFSYK